MRNVNGGLDDAHVRHKFARKMETRQLYARLVLLQLLKQRRGDALRSLARIVPREHPVDVGIVHRPKTLANVHRKMVGGRYHKYLPVLRHKAALLQVGQYPHQLTANELLLNLVATHRANYRHRLLAAAKNISIDVKRLPVRRLHRKYLYLFHLRFFDLLIFDCQLIVNCQLSIFNFQFSIYAFTTILAKSDPS